MAVAEWRKMGSVVVHKVNIAMVNQTQDTTHKIKDNRVTWFPPPFERYVMYVNKSYTGGITSLLCDGFFGGSCLLLL